MTIHVNIGEAKTRLSELIAAAKRGEEVIVANAGQPQIRLVPVDAVSGEERERVALRRRGALGMWSHLVGNRDIVVRDLKQTEDEVEEGWRRTFGPAD